MSNKVTVRYIGHRMLANGGRGFEFSLAATGLETALVTIDAPAALFAGAEAIIIQEGPGICYETLKSFMDRDSGMPPRRFTLTSGDVALHRKATKVNRLYSPGGRNSTAT